MGPKSYFKNKKIQRNVAPVQPLQMVSRYYKFPFRKAKNLSGQQI